MRTFAISALREPPFPAGRHEATDRVAGESVEWARAFGLIDSSHRVHRLQRADAAGLAGRASPDGSADGLRLLTDLISWLFVMDDACDEDGLGADPGRLAPAIGTLLDVLDRCGDPDVVPPAAGPLGDALHDLCRRTRLHDRPALLLRFVHQVREYLLALLWEATNRERRRVPEVAEYVQLRRHIGGVHPCLTLTDLASQEPPEPGRHADPALAALDLLAVDLVCWCNDLFSYGKESRADPDAHNLVTVIAHETGTDEPGALRAAADRFNQGLTAYLSAEDALLASGDDELRSALAARRNWIRATYDWSLVAARYA
ncbi:Terpene synthase family, metal binding domain [Micromonospora coriariae]|uniref:Terpene synthase n=1 Tax=Micromonospora coriariae TaxID=285665 RepID=A0A1C4WXZ9_9ACTN|nr:terpene synthase [Micromonospora coriariae]SCF00731.1 Terpene synthase family, metal binding domain [Micromonospora coriariae]